MNRTFGEKIPGAHYFDRAGAYLIDIKGDKVLTVKTPKGYFLLGGGIEEGENSEECLIRECLEESGFSIKIDKYLFAADTYCIHERRGYFHPIQYYFSGSLIEKVQEPVETDHSLEWILADELEEKMYVKQQVWAVEQYMKEKLEELR